MTEESLVSKLEELCDAFLRDFSLDRMANVFQMYRIRHSDVRAQHFAPYLPTTSTTSSAFRPSLRRCLINLD